MNKYVLLSVALVLGLVSQATIVQAHDILDDLQSLHDTVVSSTGDLGEQVVNSRVVGQVKGVSTMSDVERSALQERIEFLLAEVVRLQQLLATKLVEVEYTFKDKEVGVTLPYAAPTEIVFTNERR